MAKDDAHFRLRIPPDLKVEIEAAAAANNRSINAEIVSRLERTNDLEDLVRKSLDQSQRLTADVAEMIEVLRWTNEQMQLMGGLIEHIATTDGNLDPGFMTALRAMVATKGRDTSFPVDIEK